MTFINCEYCSIKGKYLIKRLFGGPLTDLVTRGLTEEGLSKFRVKERTGKSELRGEVPDNIDLTQGAGV